MEVFVHKAGKLFGRDAATDTGGVETTLQFGTRLVVKELDDAGWAKVHIPGTGEDIWLERHNVLPFPEWLKDATSNIIASPTRFKYSVNGLEQYLELPIGSTVYSRLSNPGNLNSLEYLLPDNYGLPT